MSRRDDLDRAERRDTRLIGLFLLGLVAFSPVLLQILGRPVAVFGLPLLYLYLFAAWAVVIALIAVHAETRPRTGGSSEVAPGEDER